MKQTHASQSCLPWLFRQTAGFRGLLLFLNILALLRSGLSILSILLLKHLVDFVSQGQLRLFLCECVKFLLVLLAQTGLNLIHQAFSQKIRQDLVMRQRNRLLEHILHSDYGRISGFHTGDLISRMTSDLQLICEGCTELLPSLLFLCLNGLLAGGILIFFFGKTALLFGLLYLAACLLISVTQKRIKGLHRGVQERYSRNQALLQELLTCLLPAKTFSGEERFQQLYRSAQQDFMDFRLRRWFLQTMAQTGVRMLSGGIFFATLVIGCLGIYYQKFTFGGFLAVLQLLSYLQSFFADLPSLLSRFYALSASVERIEELEKIPTEAPHGLPADLSGAVFHGLCVEELWFSYGTHPVLQGADFTLRRGEAVAICGPSGCGKSTLFLLLLHLYAPQRGRILLHLGERSLDADSSLRSLFAYVPQTNYILSGTIRDNLTLWDDRISPEACEEALRISCADGFVHALPLGLDTPLRESGADLSVGQLQRLCIARAVLSGAPILLLDEATSALDGETEGQVLRNIRALPGRTVLIVTHRPAALQICDRILLFQDGQLREVPSVRLC